MARRWLLAALFALGLPTAAQARGALTLGPIARVGLGEKADHVGVRGAMEGQFVLLAVERYTSQAEVRTRGELALHLAIPFGRGVSVEPVIGLMPYDRTESADGSTVLCVSATGGLRFVTPILGQVYLLAEPLRVEKRLIKVTLPAAGGLPIMDDSGLYEYTSAAALGYVW